MKGHKSESKHSNWHFENKTNYGVVWEFILQHPINIAMVCRFYGILLNYNDCCICDSENSLFLWRCPLYLEAISKTHIPPPWSSWEEGRAFCPWPPSWVGDGGSMRWNISGVRFYRGDMKHRQRLTWRELRKDIQQSNIFFSSRKSLDWEAASERKCSCLH